MIGIPRKEKKKSASGSTISTSTTTSNIPASIASSRPNLNQVVEDDNDDEPPLEDFASQRDGAEDGSDAETISSEGTVRAEPRLPPSRPRGESKEDKKARKLGVKAERSARRVEKRTRQETFGQERKTQLKGHERAVGSGRASDLTALASGGAGGVNVVRL
jgi:protein LTV1